MGDFGLYLLLLPAAFMAGLVDAVVGGGGLIQVPALFSGLPHAAPATLFGTNKLSSICGTLSATWRYAQRIRIPWRLVGPAAALAFASSFLGAMSVSLLPQEWVRPVVLVLLATVAIHTFRHKDFGHMDLDIKHGRRHMWGAGLLGAAIGFYDGFFGPGTGSFLLFLFVRFFGLDFLRASASAKVVNLTTNAAALVYFVPAGHVLWALGLGMAACNVTGAHLGAALALTRGSRFVRRLFLAIVVSLMAKLVYQTLFQS